MRRVAEFDALRGLAVLVVLLFHLDPLRFFPGWSGVDLFFVLSGYLITAILVEQVEAGATLRGLWGRFFARRALRIWPIYYLTLVGLVIFSRTLPHPPPEGWVPYALVFAQNTATYAKRPVPPPHPAFDQTWTLALEEQFYLVWPVAVAWAVGRGPDRSLGRLRLGLVCGLVIALNLALRSRDNGILPNHYNERLLATRSDGFALGALVAIALAEGGWARLRPDLGRAAGGSMVAASAAYFAWGCWRYGALGFVGLPTPSWPGETILMFGVGYAGVVGLVALGSGARWLAPLRLAPLTYLGQISYGVYLYHVIVYWAIDGFGVPPGPTLRYAQPVSTQALKVAASIALAALSWHLVERPILARKDRVAPYPLGGTSTSLDSR